MNDNKGRPNGSDKDNKQVGGEDNNIFRFRNKEEMKKVTADKVLTQIVYDGDAQDVLVISWGEDGTIDMFSSTITTEKAVHGLECAKQTILMNEIGL